MRGILTATKFKTFLDDDGKALARLRQLPQRIRNPLRWVDDAFFVKRAMSELGLYRGDAFRRFLLDQIAIKFPVLRGRPDVTFEDLKEQGCRPLKIVATDLGSRGPRVYSAAGGREQNGSVLDAVRVPDDIHTLDFELDAAKTDALYNAGMAEAHSFFATIVPQWAQARTDVERLQAQTGVSNHLVAPVLEAIGLEFERRTDARNVRVNVMMPTPRGTRIVVYQFGMDADPDIDLELGIDAGCSGRAWTSNRFRSRLFTEAESTRSVAPPDSVHLRPGAENEAAVGDARRLRTPAVH